VAGGYSDHGNLSGLGDDDHTQYLLATGARTGASSSIQPFTNGVQLGTIQATATSDIDIVLADAGGTYGVEIQDSALATLFRMDSNGLAYYYGATWTQEAQQPNWLQMCYSNTATHGSLFRMFRSRGTSGSPLYPQSGDLIGYLDWYGNSGTTGARIASYVTQNWASASGGGDLRFYTTANGGASSTERMRIDNAGKVGIGTTAIPHGAVGFAQLALEGTNASAAGPHIQTTTASDDYPLLQMLSWQHDNVNLVFDAYYGTGGWRSSDVGSNFVLAKTEDTIRLRYDSGIAAGSLLSWNVGFCLDANGNFGIGTGTPSDVLHVVDAVGWQGVSITNALADNTAPYLRWVKSRGGGSALVDDYAGGFDARIINSVSANVLVGSFNVQAKNVTSGSEQGLATLSVRDGGTVRSAIVILPSGNVGINQVTPTAQLHVVQPDAAAQPVLMLDQADVSEEMIEFATTIGVGNAIEAVGAKSLTTTHFIKVTLPGALTRYIPVGTIA
jgi:hypothetical protein